MSASNQDNTREAIERPLQLFRRALNNAIYAVGASAIAIYCAFFWAPSPREPEMIATVFSVGSTIAAILFAVRAFSSYRALLRHNERFNAP